MGQIFRDITNITDCQIKITIHKQKHKVALYKWLYEVCNDFEYSSTTYLIALFVIEEYTHRYSYELNEYQLIGVTCLYIAAKYEETTTKSVKLYEYVTDGACKISEIFEKEKAILECLNYDLDKLISSAIINFDFVVQVLDNESIDVDQAIRFALFSCIFAMNLTKETNGKELIRLVMKTAKQTTSALLNRKLSQESLKFIQSNKTLHDYFVKE
ncbi:CCNE [Enterospora canceri]|uniref:CCNE n=1 Tax=Enterospora canceri TaxID=1081671 RepID=A0A1Y1S8L3_9MICR|nr:CCNE [Enterospora canceri]